MNCHQFRAQYSDFADGLLDEVNEVRFHAHLAECAACRRFDAAFRRGLCALRRLPPATPSLDFDDRLFARLAVEPAGAEPESRYLVGIAGAVLVLAVVGAVGWEARMWIAPAEAPKAARTAAPAVTPFRARFTAEHAAASRGFRLVPAGEDSAARGPSGARGVEVTIDWMAP